MAASAGDLIEIHSWVGDLPDDSDLNGRWLRLGSVATVALEILRGRRAAMLADPTKLGIDAETTEDWTANLKALDADIKTLTGMVAADTIDPAGATGFATTGELVRTDRPCR